MAKSIKMQADLFAVQIAHLDRLFFVVRTMKGNAIFSEREANCITISFRAEAFK